jgi:hypothetical protein
MMKPKALFVGLLSRPSSGDRRHRPIKGVFCFMNIQWIEEDVIRGSQRAYGVKVKKAAKV